MMPSCTFMDIAKKYGVDYGDVLMATEIFRPQGTINELHDQASRRIPAACAYEILTACAKLRDF